MVFLTAEYAGDAPQPEHDDESGSVDRPHRVTEGHVQRERDDDDQRVEQLPWHAEVLQAVHVQLHRNLQQEQRQDRDRDVVQHLDGARVGAGRTGQCETQGDRRPGSVEGGRWRVRGSQGLRQ